MFENKNTQSGLCCEKSPLIVTSTNSGLSQQKLKNGRSYCWLIIASLLALALALVVGSVYIMVSSRKVDKFSDWKIYQNEVYGFEFKYPAEYVLQEIEQYGVKSINFYDSQVGDFASLRFNLSIDTDPLSGADPLSVMMTPDRIIDGPESLAIDSKQAFKYKILWSDQGQEYVHDFIVIRRPGKVITLATAGLKPNSVMFEQLMSTFKFSEPSLEIFDKVSFSFPKSCQGRCSIDGKLSVGDSVRESFQTVAKDYTGAIDGNYGVVTGTTYCANGCLETFLILVGDMSSQPKQLDDVYIGVNPYIRDIKISNQIVTLRYVPEGNNKLMPQSNPETKILSYIIVDNRLVPIN